MLKKILKGIGIFLLVLIIALAAAPFLFKDKIKAMIVKTINDNLDAKVAFEDVDLSLFRNFPKASVNIQKLSIINKAPFAGDTLVYMGELNLNMSVKELFKGETEPMNIDAISSKNAKINILFNTDGLGNFDIALKKDDTKSEDTSESKPFAMRIKNYDIQNLHFRYYDARSKINLVIDSLNHKGTGDFAASKLDLITTSTAKISLDMDKMNYMKNVALSLDAVLAIDLENNKYTFKENKALINQLPLEFDGFIQLLETGQQYDLAFKTPTSSFKNFLGLVPAAYAGNLNTVKTTGDFTINGKVNGTLTDTTIPKFNVAIASNNASFQYPDLPKSVNNIVIDTKIINETGLVNDTYINLDKLSFRIDQDVFNAKASIRNIAENALVDANLNGTINLANVTKAYPLKLDTPLSGILKANIVTKFDMKSVETSQYQNMQNSGNLTLTGFNYSGPELAKPIQITQAAIQFNPNQVRLNQFDAKTGQSDMAITGTLDNFYGFLFKKQILKGNFNLNANQLLIADFMAPTPAPVATTTKGAEKQAPKATTATKEAVKIPAFLDCSITAKANTVVYDNLTLKDVSGKMIIRDEAVKLENIKTSIFGGKITADGLVSTKNKVPTFTMDLGLNTVDIAQSFTQLDMLKSIAPIAGIINGKLNSTIKVNGTLDAKEMTPDLKTLSGDLIGQLLSTTINSSNSDVLTALTSKIKFIDPNKINLNDLKTHLTFHDGKVDVKPFDIKYQDIKVTVGGQHGFDQTMNYNLKFDVPAKYLGTEANKVLSSLSAADAGKLQNIPVNAIVTGNFKSPKITTDIQTAVTNLANQLVKQQKDKLINQGTSALSNLLNNTKKDTTKTTTTTPKEDVKTKAAEAIKGLFGKKKKE